MPSYIEYDLGDDATILIEAPEDTTSGVVRASRGAGEVSQVKAKKGFEVTQKWAKPEDNKLSKGV